MPTQPYIGEDGKRKPGVTTVVGSNLGWSKDALVRWANKQGLEGIDIRSTTKQASDAGTVAHEMIEAYLQDRPVAGRVIEDAAPGALPLAEQAYKSFTSWLKSSQLRVIATELWGVDDEYETGFCPDAISLNSEGDVDLLDWKSSRGLYAEHYIQVATYRKFLERAFLKLGGWVVPIRGVHVVRFGKECDSFHHVYWSAESMEAGWKTFTWLRAIHAQRPKVEGYVR